MPPSVSELKNLKNFRGNILDRQFPVQFDPATGMYSYNYVDKTPEVEAKLKALKYFRKSSKDLKEIEADLAEYLKKQVSAPPPVKGEITLAAEQEAAKLKTAENILQKGFERAEAGITNTEEQEAVLGEAINEKTKLERPKKVNDVKKRQNAIFEKYNQRLAQGLPVNIDPTTKRAKLTPANQAAYDMFQGIVDAADYINSLEAKEKKGEKLTPGEVSQQREAITKLNTYRLPEAPTSVNVSKKINMKANYNAAKATYTQLKNKKNMTLNEKNKVAEAWATMEAYLSANPTVARNVEEQEALQMTELARRRLKELDAKTQPLSPEDSEEKKRLQKGVNLYTKYIAKMKPQATEESANLQETGARNIFNESAPLAPAELSNAAFQARRTKAQKVLNYFTKPGAPAAPTAEQAALRNNAQRIISAFAKLNNTSAKSANRNAARNTIKKSNFLNKARTLSVPTEGGRRKTRKIRRSNRKTYRRRH